MCDVYRIFSRQWDHMLDYSEDARFALYENESRGIPIPNRETNGYLVGKQWLSVHVEMWKEDLLAGHLIKHELYEDGTFPHWWLDSALKGW